MTFLLTTDKKILDYLQHRFDHVYERDYWHMESLVNTVQNMDACDFLQTIPDGSVDFVFTDEPYGVAPTRVNLKARSDITTDFEWDKIKKLPEEYKHLLVGSGPEEPRLPAHLLSEWVWEAYRILKSDGMLVNFGQAEFIGSFRDVCRYADFTWRASIPWCKTNAAPHFRKSNFRSGHEQVLFASKGKTKNVINFMEQQEMVNFIVDQRCPNCDISFPMVLSNKYDEPEWFKEVFEVSGLTNKKTPHPTEKPEWLVTKFMLIMSQKGQIVVDPFCGGGTIPWVAKKLGRKYIANDISEEWATYTRLRLENQNQSLI